MRALQAVISGLTVTSELTVTSGLTGVAEHCQAWAIPCVIRCLQVGVFHFFLLCRRLHKQMRESASNSVKFVIHHVSADAPEPSGCTHSAGALLTVPVHGISISKTVSYVPREPLHWLSTSPTSPL